MTSFGFHYRVQLDEEGVQHITFDSGVGVLAACARGEDPTHNNAKVQLARVGILKDIVVLNYGHMSIVLMDVSWVVEDSELMPRLRRDEHGFWLANLAARPRDKTTPYLLPALASQVWMPNYCILCIVVLQAALPSSMCWPLTRAYTCACIICR